MFFPIDVDLVEGCFSIVIQFEIWFTETDSHHLLESTYTHNPGSDIDIFYQDIYELLHCWIMIGGYEPKLCSIDIKATVFCAINSPAKAPFKSFKNFKDSTKPCSSQRWGKFSRNFSFDFFLLSVLTPVGHPEVIRRYCSTPLQLRKVQVVST